jgi:hypothetical protein
MQEESLKKIVYRLLRQSVQNHAQEFKVPNDWARATVNMGPQLLALAEERSRGMRMQSLSAYVAELIANDLKRNNPPPTIEQALREDMLMRMRSLKRKG